MASDAFTWADDLGPAAVAYLSERRSGLRAVVVVDNVACGPAIGGVRMAPDATAAEAFRLARAMTLKNAAAGLAHGGGKAVIVADPHGPPEAKERLIRAFARAIRDLTDYIPGPDMGTDETCMAWIEDEIGRAVGLPRELGGIPLDEIGATGVGLGASVEVACRLVGMPLSGARVAIQGYGAVGRHAARVLSGRGAVLVAASDTHGTVARAEGLDIAELAALKAAGRSVVEAKAGNAGPPEAVIDADCDIWIPAARPDVIDVGNVGRLRARLVAQGANIPITPEAEDILHRRGIVSVPDFIANAGGVICAAVEYHGGTEAQALATVAERVARNTEAVLDRAMRERVPPRRAALDLARGRVLSAMALRRWA
jgi:glutamate dehydrogenase (NAD(P)+)